MIPIAIPAFLFVFIYFGLQIFYAWYYFGGSSTAYFAHIGGFIVGAIIAVFFRLFKKDYKDRLYS